MAKKKKVDQDNAYHNTLLLLKKYRDVRLDTDQINDVELAFEEGEVQTIEEIEFVEE